MGKWEPASWHTRRGASSSRNGRDSNAQYLGVKRSAARPSGPVNPHPPARHQHPPGVNVGRRQRQTRYSPSPPSTVQFGVKRGRKTVNIVPAGSLSDPRQHSQRRRSPHGWPAVRR
ncbi:hypothetical protein HBB16_17105 [Pseudonocardia sp. MCCB 268]|nr:hypothetical protein [Pseudonocardia cytotoxica]